MGQQIDLTGQRFGRLTAIRYLKPRQGERLGRWECRCDCGQEALCTSGNLRRGNSTSCGCKRFESRNKIKAGQRFGRLVVLRRDGSKRHGKSCFAAWLCRCDCGAETRVISMSLTNGDTRSCGCLLSESTRARAIENFLDLTGERFGWLRVIDRASRPGRRSNVRWLCQCACGELTILPGNSLTSGNTISCGCARHLGVTVRNESVRAISNLYGARRRAAERQALSPFDEDLFELVEHEAYALAQRRTRMTGVRWVVDHIIPLQSEIVCGLHNEYNLAVITEAANGRKKNFYWPDMP